MTGSTDTDLWISWTEYDRAIIQLAQQVYQSGWQFDLVLCLARGGLRPGDVFSRVFQVPLAILSVSSYREQAGTERGNLNIASNLTVTNAEVGGQVLLLDDLIDSGVTLNVVKQHLQQQFSKITEIKSAVIWRKQAAQIEADFCLHRLAGNPWIHQPFEEYDDLKPAQMTDWLNQTATSQRDL